ncbi:MAG: SDR family NAD(P)-dependent oxidoreductase [Rhizomicrobium sp.]
MYDLMFKDGLLKGKRILITGGGTGLGEVMTEAYAQLGAEVYICGRRAGVVEETAKRISDATGSKVSGIGCDIRVAEAVDEMIARIWEDGGALTGLVNNAAGNFISRTKDLTPKGFNAISDIVFRGTFYVTLACGKRWIAAGQKASVISILTTWIWNGGPLHGAERHGEGRREHHDQVARDRMGPERHSSECDCAGTVSHQGRVGTVCRRRPAAAATNFLTSAGAFPWAATARWWNLPISRRS